MLHRVSILLVLLFCSVGIVAAQSDSGPPNSGDSAASSVPGISASQRANGTPIEVDIVNLQATPIGVSIALRSPGSQQTLYMMVGTAEGQAIARALGHEKTSRPMTHDLLKQVLDRNGWKVERVVIREFRDDSFQADMVVTKASHGPSSSPSNSEDTEIYDCRPSDALAVGLLYDAKIYVNPQVFTEQPQGAIPQNAAPQNEPPQNGPNDQPSTLQPSGPDSLSL